MDLAVLHRAEEQVADYEDSPTMSAILQFVDKVLANPKFSPDIEDPRSVDAPVVQELTLNIQIDDLEEEDYRGQRDEYRRSKIVDAAVDAAVSVMCEFSDGSVEEAAFLNAAVALRLANIVLHDTQKALLAKHVASYQGGH